jgi:predicted dehydrogenase
MADRVRWGILGNATIARVCVIPAIQKSANGRVLLLGSRGREAAREVCAEHGIAGPPVGYEDVLADDRVDAVYIPLPNHLHLPWTLKALSAGKHVLCEKPLALTAEEARTMAAAAESAGRLLMEAFMYRFHPRSIAVRERVRKGELGDIRSVRTAFCYAMAPEVRAAGKNFRLRPETGGGALMDVGCYGVSLARWILGREPAKVQAAALLGPTGVDLHLAGLLNFGPDAVASVEASFLSALQQTFAVYGTKGAVELPHDAFIPWERPARYDIREADGETGRRITVPGADEYRLMVEAFADAALGRNPLPAGPEDSVRNAAVIDALSRAARSGRAEAP